jgi:hypothetical protein
MRFGVLRDIFCRWLASNVGKRFASDPCALRIWIH